MAEQLFLKRFSYLPEGMKQEILDFFEYLINKSFFGFLVSSEKLTIF